MIFEYDSWFFQNLNYDSEIYTKFKFKLKDLKQKN